MLGLLLVRVCLTQRLSCEPITCHKMSIETVALNLFYFDGYQCVHTSMHAMQKQTLLKTLRNRKE